jgi:hypothetical protein
MMFNASLSVIADSTLYAMRTWMSVNKGYTHGSWFILREETKSEWRLLLSPLSSLVMDLLSDDRSQHYRVERR